MLKYLSSGRLFLPFLLLLMLGGCESPIECTRGEVSADGRRCVSAEDCQGDSQKCLEGLMCEANQCVPVMCDEDTKCPAGICNQEGRCVSKESCEIDTEEKDCIETDYCFAGQCLPRVACSSVSCTSGATPDLKCQRERETCHEASTCANSGDCRAARYCSSEGACKPDLCVTGGPVGSGGQGGQGGSGGQGGTSTGSVTCDNGGICDPSSGKCVEPTVCGSPSDCIFDATTKTGNVCVVKGSETTTTCQPFARLCQETCRDVKNCVVTGTPARVKCSEQATSEPSACETTSECTLTEYCDRGTKTCLEKRGATPYQCQNDKYDTAPLNNNSKDDAVDWQAESVAFQLGDLSLCPGTPNGDIDYFKIKDVTHLLEDEARLVVNWALEPSSVGRQVAVALEVLYEESGKLYQAWQKTNYDDNTGSYAKTIDIVADLHDYRNATAFYVAVKYLNGDKTKEPQLGVDYSLTIRETTQASLDLCRLAENNRTRLVFKSSGSSMVAEVSSRLEHGPEFAYGNVYQAKKQCIANDVSDVPEEAFAFEVTGTQPKIVEISVLPYEKTYCDPVLLLMRDCREKVLLTNQLLEEACVDKYGSNFTDHEAVKESYKILLQPGEYTIVVTGKNKSEIGRYDLKVTQTELSCDRLTVNTCTDNTTYRKCDVFAENEITNTCSGNETCHNYGNGLVGCTSDLGGQCQEPHIFREGSALQLEFDTAAMTNQSGTGDSLFNCDGALSQSEVSGREVYVKGVIPPGKIGVVSVTPSGNNPGEYSIYTIEACGAKTCLDSTWSGALHRESRVLSYKNDTNADKEIIFVIESRSKVGTTFTLDANVIESTATQTCLPGHARCEQSGLSPIVKVCNATGTQEENVTCPGRGNCDSTGSHQGAVCEIVGDSCDKPYVLTPGEPISFNLTDFTNKVAQRNAYCGNLSGSETVPQEIVVALQASQNDRLKLEVGGAGTDAIIYHARSTCSATSPECIDGVDNESAGTSEQINAVASADGLQYFVIEQYKDGNLKPPYVFNVLGDVLTSNCDTQYPVATCAADNLTFISCDENNFVKKSSCQTSCQSTPFPHCYGNEDAKSCQTAKQLIGNSGKEEFLLNDSLSNEFEIDLGSYGDCAFEPYNSTSRSYRTTVGPDAVFAVTLKSDQLLRYKYDMKNATALSDLDSLRVYILGPSCSIAQCRNMRDGRNLRGVWQTYYARKDETIYVVVDTASVGKTAVLEWEVQDKNATSKRNDLWNSYCTSDTTGIYIDEKGEEVIFNCPNGTDWSTQCRHGACSVVKNNSGDYKGDTCQDAPLIELQKQAYFLTFQSDKQNGGQGLLTNSIAPTCGGPLNSSETNGSDYFVKVELEANDLLVVRGLSASLGSPVIYLTDDCSTLDTTCLGMAVGTDNYHDGHAYVEYKNSTGAKQTVTIGLDTKRTLERMNDAKEAYYYLLEVIPAASVKCNIGQKTCSEIGGKFIEQNCEKGDWIEKLVCTTGCDGDSCSIPKNKPDSALELTKDKGYEEDSLDGMYDTSQHVLKKLNNDPIKGANSLVYGSCPFGRAPSGPDIYYKISLNQNTLLKAKLEMKAGVNNPESDFLLYLLAPDKKTCITLAQSADAETLETPLNLEFQALINGGGDYYLVVDNAKTRLDATKSTEFKLSYEVLKGNTNCIPYATECSGDDLLVCQMDGSMQSVNCPYGCIGRACRVESENDPQNDSLNTCQSTTPELTGSALFIYDHDSGFLDKKFNLTDNNCSIAEKNDNAKNDIFIKLQLGKNGYVRVWDERSNSTFKPNYYLISESDCTSNQLNCLFGRLAASSSLNQRTTTSLHNYKPSVPQKLFLGISPRVTDSLLGNSALIFVEKNEVTCDPSSYSVTCNTVLGKTELLYCDNTNVINRFVCQSNSCDNNRCAAAPNANSGDNPFDPIRVTNWRTESGGREANFSKSIRDMNSFHQNYSGQVAACKVKENQLGFPATIKNGALADVFYEVELAPNEKLIATVQPISLGEVQIYLIDAVDAATFGLYQNTGSYPTCYAFDDKGDKQSSIEYTNNTSTAQKLLVVVDGNGYYSLYDYDLHLRVEP